MPERWRWWSGRWSERDACGAYATREDVESGEADHQCRNGGSPFGWYSKFMRDRDEQMHNEFEAAQIAAGDAAEVATEGYMTRKGAPRKYGPLDWYPASGALIDEKWASEELVNFWREGGPRPLSFPQWRRRYHEQFINPAEGGW